MKPTCFAVMLTVALARGASALPPVSEVSEPPLRVVVQRGETASEIARAHGITVKELCEANGLDNPDRVFAGQRLRLPPAAIAGPSGVSPFDSVDSPTPRTPHRQERGSTPKPVSAPRRAAETVVTEVATLGALAAAPTSSSTIVVRPAPLTRRSALDAARLERFGVARSVGHSARRAAMDVVGPFRDE